MPSALANVALLIAAPSLGCLNTYIKALSDLYRAYSLPVPDLANVHQYGSTLPSSITSVGCHEVTSFVIDKQKPSLITSGPSVRFQDANPDTLENFEPSLNTSSSSDGCQETIPNTLENHEPKLEIKIEYVDPDLNIVKHEPFEEHTSTFMTNPSSERPDTLNIIKTTSAAGLDQPANTQPCSDACTQSRADGRTYDSIKRRRCFQNSWLNDYHWLTYDRERDLMFCSVCKEFKHPLNIKLVQGSDNFRKNLLDAHQKSQSHSMSMDAIQISAK